MKGINSIIFLKNRSGAALVMVVIALLFVSILLSSVFIIVSTNTRQVVTQEQGIESYYIARSGAEAMYQALRTITPSYIEEFKNNTTTKLEDEIVFPEGKANITVTKITVDGKDRIKIQSLGIADGTNIQRKSILEFDIVGYKNVKWSR